MECSIWPGSIEILKCNFIECSYSWGKIVNIKQVSVNY